MENKNIRHRSSALARKSRHQGEDSPQFLGAQSVLIETTGTCTSPIRTVVDAFFVDEFWGSARRIYRKKGGERNEDRNIPKPSGGSSPMLPIRHRSVGKGANLCDSFLCRKSATRALLASLGHEQ
jgi:hypothetical protein